MENGNFRYEKFFLEQVDEKNLPKQLAEWAKKCLKSIACLNMTDANLILDAFKKSAKDEKIEYSLEREFDIAKQSLRARQHKIENGDLSMKAAIDNFESFKDKSVEELEEKIFEDNLIVAKDQGFCYI
ncbi:hypothetical protein MHBO_004797 [Bonamia ostreae]|uniref:Uncharacterized protein n=1 Tax=Bonamia ostreae TaxID=126728 RepID=A0ABV2AUB2_9EUKA